MSKQRQGLLLKNKWSEAHPRIWKKYQDNYYKTNKKRIILLNKRYRKKHPITKKSNKKQWEKIPKNKKLNYSRKANAVRKKRIESDPVYAKKYQKMRHGYYLKRKKVRQSKDSVKN